MIGKVSSSFDSTGLLDQPVRHRVAIYARVSTDRQGEGTSINEQIQRSRAFAESQGWRVVRIYKDIGVSGTTSDRPMLTKAMIAASEGRFDILLVHKTDRFSRSLLDLLDMVDWLAENGVKFNSITEPFDTSTYIGKAFLGLLGTFAQFERDVISERTAIGREARFKKRLWRGGQAPFGYFYNQGKGKLDVEPDEAKAIQRMFEVYAKNGDVNATGDQLWIEGFRTRKGDRFSRASLLYRLSNPRYLGWERRNGDSYHEADLAIINETLFRQVNDLLERDFSSLEGMRG